jgi:hypothetical protein
MNMRDDLADLKAILWASLEDAEPDKRASLAREYRTTVEKLAALDQGAKKEAGDPIDELASRRAARTGRSGSGEGDAARRAR